MKKSHNADFKVLALDLDGTYLEEPFSSTINNNLLIIYATGRCKELALEALDKHKIPLPNYLITDVGNRIYHIKKSQLHLDQCYELFNSSFWLPLHSFEIDEKKFDVQLQTSNNIRRKSYWASSKKRRDTFIAYLHQLPIIQKYAEIRSDFHNNRYWIDVLPAYAGKSTAINYILLLEGLFPHQCIAVGDSMNDYDMLDGRFHRIISPKATHALQKALSLKTPVKQSIFQSISSLLSAKNITIKQSSYLAIQKKAIFHSSSSLSFKKGLVVWPNFHINPKIKKENFETFQDTLESFHQLMHKQTNVWWLFSSLVQKKRIVNRYLAINKDFIIKFCKQFIKERSPSAKILGIMANGSFFYGPANMQANDLDLSLLISGYHATQNGFELPAPGLKDAITAPYHKRLKYERLGFGILKLEDIHENNHDPIFLSIIHSMTLTGLPIYGQYFSFSSLSPWSYLYQTNQLIYQSKNYLFSNKIHDVFKARLRYQESLKYLQGYDYHFSYPHPIPNSCFTKKIITNHDHYKIMRLVVSRYKHFLLRTL